jgi:hypothetical protein
MGPLPPPNSHSARSNCWSGPQDRLASCRASRSPSPSTPGGIPSRPISRRRDEQLPAGYSRITLARDMTGSRNGVRRRSRCSRTTTSEQCFCSSSVGDCGRSSTRPLGVSCCISRTPSCRRTSRCETPGSPAASNGTSVPEVIGRSPSTRCTRHGSQEVPASPFCACGSSNACCGSRGAWTCGCPEDRGRCSSGRWSTTPPPKSCRCTGGPTSPCHSANGRECWCPPSERCTSGTRGARLNGRFPPPLITPT